MKEQGSSKKKEDNAKPLRGAETKRLILDTAMKIVSTHGLQGITIGELAKKIGMSKSGLFAHFENKDNLQLKILKLASDQFTERVLKPSFQKPKGIERILALFKNWMDYYDDDVSLPGGSIFIAASFELDDRPGILKDFVQNSQKELILNIEKAVQFAIDEGHFKKTTSTKDFAWKMYSFVLGYHHYKRMLHNPLAREFVEKAFHELIDTNKV